LNLGSTLLPHEGQRFGFLKFCLRVFISFFSSSISVLSFSVSSGRERRLTSSDLTL